MVVHSSAMTLLKLSSPATTSPSSSAICQIETSAFTGFESRNNLEYRYLGSYRYPLIRPKRLHCRVWGSHVAEIHIMFCGDVAEKIR